MINQFFSLLSLLFPLLCMSQDDNQPILTSQHVMSVNKDNRGSAEVEPLSTVDDQQGTIHLYEELLHSSVPEWKKERLLYNIGTLYLIEAQPIKALSFFRKIHPEALFVSRFAKHLFLNQGIAYLECAKQMTEGYPLQLQALFIRQSFKYFDRARQLECQDYLLEKEGLCQSSFLLNQWIKHAHQQLNDISRKQTDQWIKNGTVESLSSLLYKAMGEWLNRLEQFNIDSSASLARYFQFQGASLFPIWNHLKEKKITEADRRLLETSIKAASLALTRLEKQDFSSAKEVWKEAMKILFPLTFREDQALQYVKLGYDLLFLQEQLRISSLKNQLKQIEAFEVDENKRLLIEKTALLLKKSIERIHEDNVEEARFFLIGSYCQFLSLVKKEGSAKDILQQTLDRAKEGLELCCLAQEIKTDEKETIALILKNLQEIVLSDADLFIPSVLREQNQHFDENREADSRCQEIPWNQVIPLFDQGFQLEKEATKRLNRPSIDFESIVPYELQAIKQWEKALNLMTSPPKKEGVVSTDQELKEQFRKIQEMYLEDQGEVEQNKEELHSW